MATGIAFDTEPEAAVEHFEGKGLAPAFSYADVWGKQHQEAFTVAKMLDVDLLQATKDSLLKAQKEGLTFEEWKEEIEPEMRRKGWWGRQEMVDPKTGKKRWVQLGSEHRLKLIFRQNMLAAYNAGRQHQLEALADRRPWWRYESVRDIRTRPQHRAWDGVLLRHDHPWWQTHFPPNGYFCRCTVSSMSEGKRARQGLEPTADGDIAGYGDTTPWTNPRTGEVLDVPVGQDPGFDHMPGSAGAGKTSEILADTLAATAPELALAAGQSLVKGEAFQQFFNDPRPGQQMLVGAMPEAVQQALGASGPQMLLSSDTMAKQKRHHPELTATDYARLPELLYAPDIAIQDSKRDHTAMLFKRDGEWWMAAVKTTGDKKENYVTSFRRAQEKEIPKQKAKGKVVIGGGDAGE